MDAKGKGLVYAVAGAIPVLVLALAARHTQAGQAQESPASATPKTAEQAFKNIQVLKGIPADQLFPAMQFISASLGVECNYCHVGREFDKDDKENKKTARKMIQMMMAINKDSFEGRREVTCYTCHHGTNDPVGIPVIADQDRAPERREGGPEGAKPATLPNPNQIIEKFAQAVGGAEAYQKITSRVEKGKITAFGGQQFPVEIYAKAPDKRLSVMHTPRGESLTAFDGQHGWLSGMGPAPGVRDMEGAELDAARLDADFYLPVRLTHTFRQFRIRPPEKMGDQEVNVVFALQPGQPPVKLCFDEQSGLLVREVRFAETPLGRLPTQVDFADYRDVEGVKIPYRWTLARPGGRFTIQVESVQQNVPIDDAKFAKPAAPETTGAKTP